MKIRPVGAKFFMRTDRQADGHDEANSSFSQFCEFARRTTSTFCCWTRGLASKAALLHYRFMEYTDTVRGKFFLLKPWENIGGGSRGTTPLIFNIETRQMSCQLHAPAALIMVNYPRNRWLGGPQIWCGHNATFTASNPHTVCPGIEPGPTW